MGVVPVILKGHGHSRLLSLQGWLIISRAKAWNFSCLPEWHEIKSQEKAIKPSYMLLLAYVQSKEFVVVAWLFTELRRLMRLCSGPVGRQVQWLLSSSTLGLAPLVPLLPLTFLLARARMLKSFPWALVYPVGCFLCSTHTCWALYKYVFISNLY